METIIETDEGRAERIQRWRLHRALGDAPALLAHVRAQAISGGVDRGEVLREQTAPVRLRALSDSDSVYAQLIDWVMNIADALRLSPPSTAVLAWNMFDPDNAKDDYRGFRAGTTAAAAELLTRIQTLWLTGHMTQIESWSGYREFREDVTDKLWRLRSRFPMEDRRERSTSDRECPACGEHAVSADWWSPEMRDVDVSCASCGFKIEADVKVRIGAKRVGVLDLLDWETRENRECTCTYPGDPLSSCPVHHPEGVLPHDLVGLPVVPKLREGGLVPAAPIPVVARDGSHRGGSFVDVEFESDLRPGEVVCQSCFMVKPCPCEDGQ